MSTLGARGPTWGSLFGGGGSLSEGGDQGMGQPDVPECTGLPGVGGWVLSKVGAVGNQAGRPLPLTFWLADLQGLLNSWIGQ